MDKLRDVVLVLARVVVGVVFIVHGQLKLSNAELGPAAFEQLGIPLSTPAFWFTVFVEMVGGVAFIVGLLLPVVGVLFAVVTVGAMFYVHLPNGFWAEGGGYEYVLVLAFASVALGLTARPWSVDALITARRTRVAVAA